MAGGAGSSLGRGGMLTKILAAKRAAHSGANTVIASGREADVLTRLASGEMIGTQLIARTARIAARKQWMADHLQVRGHVVIDDGAVEKLTAGGKSLLPIGVIDVKGAFARGEVIACVNAAGQEVARGITNYSSCGGAADSSAAERRDRNGARLYAGARTDPSRQPGAGLTPQRTEKAR